MIEKYQLFKIKDIDSFSNVNFKDRKNFKNNILSHWKIEKSSIEKIKNVFNFIKSNKYSLELENDEKLIIKGNVLYISFLSNLRENLKENFRIYVIKKTDESNSKNEKVFIQKFELNGIDKYFYEENLTENGTKRENIDNEIGQSKDQQIDISQTMNKSFGR